MKSIFAFTQYDMKEVLLDDLTAEYFSTVISRRMAKFKISADPGSSNAVDRKKEFLTDLIEERKKIENPITHKTVIGLSELIDKIDSLIPSS